MTLRTLRLGAAVVAVGAFVMAAILSFTQESEDGGTEITIGEHVTRTVGPLTFNVDTIWATLIAGGLVMLLGFLARRALTRDSDDHVPTKLQLFWETIVGQVNTQVEDNLGRVHSYVAPLAISLFFFILFANCSSCCRPSSTTTPTCSRRPPPTPTSPTRSRCW